MNHNTDQIIDAAYVNSLVELVNACKKYGTKIDTVYHVLNGWRVTFNGFNGDAICHDGSYGSPNYGSLFEQKPNDWTKSGPWETIDFPWDYGDVSVHTAEWLAKSIKKLSDGEIYNKTWEEEE